MITNYVDDSYKSILCLNGSITEFSFLQTTKLPIIAADGAGNTLMQHGIKPDLVIGDLDSLCPAIAQDVKTKYEPCQNSSDFQKALKHLEQKDLLPTIILGMHGGFIDHILNNINIFIASNNVFYAPPVIGYVVKEEKSFSFPLNTKVSLMGIPSSVVTTQGLKWELDQSLLTFPGANSCFNRTITKTISINVHQGNVLTLFYVQEMHDAGVESKQIQKH